MRALSLVAALAGLILLGPLLLGVALAVRLTSPGPVFYRARRAGRGGRTFQLLKFRTMVEGADRSGPAVTGREDRRITPLGRILRATKIDELPQLVNVLRGDMNLVGPRPEDPRYVRHYDERQRSLLEHLPGITSPASVAFRHEESLLDGEDWEEKYLRQVLPAKLEIELEYHRRRSFGSDLVILWMTFLALFRRPDTRGVRLPGKAPQTLNR